MFDFRVLMVSSLVMAAVRGFVMGPENTQRTVTAILRVTNGGQYGYWGTPEFCPSGTFASGFSMKIEAQQMFGDDTALNAIRLTCSDETGHVHIEGTISSDQGPFGDWGKTETCKQWFNNTDYLTRFALQVEAPQGGGDDTAANFVKFQCRPLAGVDPQVNVTELVAAPGRGYWGQWSEWSDECPTNSAICGMNTKIESLQGDADDTTLNDVIFYCCSKNGQGNGNGNGIIGK